MPSQSSLEKLRLAIEANQLAIISYLARGTRGKASAEDDAELDVALAEGERLAREARLALGAMSPTG